jgi:hypothetical protein
VTTTNEPLVTVGDLITVPEGDYTIGRGILRMRVIHILQRPDEDLREIYWIRLMGVEVGADGSDGRHRTVLVRSWALQCNPPQRRGGIPDGRRRRDR